jgi:DNA polymerase III delta prime subunit
MNANALLITGPPGVGKTLFAEYLAELLQQQTPPFAVTHERDSISNIRNILSESGPALFVISDPWGTTVHETPTSLSHELVNLLIHASADKKFIITTRSDLYERALEATKLFLSEYVVEIVPESYSEHSRWSIATQGLADIVGGIEVAERNRLEISRDLTTPYELSAFNLILKKEIQKYDICVNNEFAWLDHYEAKWLLDGEELDERVKIETIIAKAASKTTIYMTLLMLKGWSLHGIEHTAICWTLLSALGTVKKSVFIEEFLRVSEESSSDLTPKDFVEFLCNSHIVSSENDFIYVHSYQSEGMAKLIQENSKAAMQGLKIASDYLLGAIRDRGFSSVAGNYIRVISTWLGFFRTVAPFKGIVTSVDRLLESQCRLSRDQGFYEAATLSMWWGYGQSNFIKILSFFNISWPEHGSKARLNYSEDDLKLVLMDRNTVHYLIPRIIKEYLPFTNTSYQHHTQEFVDLVFRFDINLGDECRAALDIIYDRMYVDYGDGVCDEPDLDVNIKPLKSLLALYSSDPYIDKFTSQDTDLYNPYK